MSIEYVVKWKTRKKETVFLVDRNAAIQATQAT